LREILSGCAIRIGNPGFSIGREHLSKNIGDERNELSLVEYIRTKDDRIPLGRRISPIESAN
jgi:hypothetical protein